MLLILHLFHYPTQNNQQQTWQLGLKSDSPALSFFIDRLKVGNSNYKGSIVVAGRFLTPYNQKEVKFFLTYVGGDVGAMTNKQQKQGMAVIESIQDYCRATVKNRFSINIWATAQKNKESKVAKAMKTAQRLIELGEIETANDLKDLFGDIKSHGNRLPRNNFNINLNGQNNTLSINENNNNIDNDMQMNENMNNNNDNNNNDDNYNNNNNNNDHFFDSIRDQQQNQ